MNITKILNKHKLWLETNGGRGKPAYLREADLRGANLTRADLPRADLREAILKWAYLPEANLTGADLRGADLRRTDLTGAILPNFEICPEKGSSFIGYKKVHSTNGNDIILTLEIPEDAKRTSSLVGRKCRASKAIIRKIEGEFNTDKDKLVSIYDELFFYPSKIGETIIPDSYNDDIRVECTNGIHFFMTKEEAEEFSL